MTEENKVPKLRFPEFTDDWEQRKLVDVVDSIDTGKSKFNKEGSSGEYPILGSTSVIGYDDEYDYEGDFILTARVGANAGSLYRHAGKVKISDNTVFIRTSQNIDFIYHLLTRFDIKKLSFGTGQPLVKASELKKLELMMPIDFNEQIKIGSFFLNLDNLITLHQRKLETIQKLKQGFLQKLFPQNGRNFPELRFPGFTGDWKQQKLGELTDFVTGKAFSSDLDDRGSYVVMDMGAVSQEGTRIETKKTNILRDPLCKGDLIMPKDDIGGGLIIGRTAYIPTDNRYLLGDHVYRLRFANENSLFVHYQINSSGLRKQIMPLVTGSAQLGLNSKNVQGVILNIPSLEEQLKIGVFFLKLDDLISLHQRKLEIYQNIKKGLMQQMFV